MQLIYSVAHKVVTALERSDMTQKIPLIKTYSL